MQDEERSSATAEQVRALATEEGRALLDALPPYRQADAFAVSDRLRRAGHAPDLVSAAMTQSELRARAGAKLGAPATELFLTREGLEQATRPEVASRHAATLAGLAPGPGTRVWDLGCGIGLDARAFATAGLRVEAVERDPLTAAVAAANLADLDATVHETDVTEILSAIGPDDLVWFDPARRVPGQGDAAGRSRRLFRLADLSPAWDLVQEVAAAAPAAGVKLAPGFSRTDLPAGTSGRWVSVDGTAVEAVVWFGAAAEPDRPVAVSALRHGVWHEIDDIAGHPVRDHPASAEQIGRWLYDPDPAVLAAGLTPALAAAVDGAEIDPGVGYVTSGTAVDLPWARRIEVTGVQPLHPRALKSWVRESGIGVLTVKKRGVSTDAEELRRRLRPRTGDRGPRPEGILVLTRLAGRPVALTARPADPLG